MAVPEFISILRNIRDVIYPAILTSEQNINNDKQSVEAVAGDLELIQTAADNALVSKENAEASAESANLSKISASESELLASNSKDTAILKAQEASDSADEIKGITAQAQTLVPGSQANVSYNPVDGKFSFGIPQGEDGEKGDNFDVDSTDVFANRSIYDNEAKGFSFLALDTSLMYFKISNTSADWSTGIEFGKGDQGDQGVQGVGISSIVRTSGDGSAGTIDVYTITLSDTTTYDFNVYQGADGPVTSVAGRTGDVILTKNDVSLNNVDNTSDLNKPVSTATTTAINNSKSVSKVASSVLLNKDSLALDNSVITKSNANVTYTGNGTTQDIVTGISSVDFTVASNGSGYYHDRLSGDCIIREDAGNVVDSGEAIVNTSKTHFKCRGTTYSNLFIDGLRGSAKYIITNTNASEGTEPNNGVISFNNDGVTIGSDLAWNNPSFTYILHQTLYTHIKWGLTKQGKRYITAYNPVTREVMTMYQGSGIAGHQIPNPLGIKLDYLEVKSLNVGSAWPVMTSTIGVANLLILNETHSATQGNRTEFAALEDGYTEFGSDIYSVVNTLNSSYISYGFANSETKIITQYQGTGVAGNFVETKDVNGVAKKPRRVIRKATSTTGSWNYYDSERGFPSRLELDTSNAEDTVYSKIEFNTNGFTTLDDDTESNASGGQYIAIVEFDTTSSNDDTYFDLPTDDTNLTLVNGKLVFTDGRASNGGYNVSTQDFTGSIDFAGISDGIKYVGLDEVGNTIAYDDVSIGLYDKTNADDNRLTFDTDSGKWFTTTGGELVTNGDLVDNSTGWTLGSSVSWSDGGLTFSASNNTDTYTSVLTLEDGEPYVIEIECSTSSGNFPIRLAESGNLTNNILLETITESSYIEFTSDGTYDVVDIRSNSVSGRVEKVSVYKKEATLDTPLTSPICFIDDKPYQITSETPMDRLEDYPSIPKNVMEDTYVSNLTVADGFDLGQKWVDVTSERASGVTYINNTGKPIEVQITFSSKGVSAVFNFEIDGLPISVSGNYSTGKAYCSFSVPDGTTYKIIDAVNGFIKFLELR